MPGSDGFRDVAQFTPSPAHQSTRVRAVMLAGRCFYPCWRGKRYCSRPTTLLLRHTSTPRAEPTRRNSISWPPIFGNGATPRGSPRQLSTYRVRKTWWQTFSRGAGSYRPSGHSTPMRLMQVFPFLQVDLFASSLNFQLPRYCSRSRDPGAWKVDAFSFHWGGIQGYAFRR